MLTDKNDNRFLNALNDIEDDLLEEIAETPIEAEIIQAAPKKQFLRIAAPAVASLSIVAAIGIGALIIGQRFTSPFGAEITRETETTATESSSGDSAFDNADAILAQKEWQDINRYLEIDVNDTESILSISNFDNLDPKYADTQSGMLTGALFDSEKCGDDCDIALLGFNVWTDMDRLGDGVILAKELRIALVKNERIITTVPVYDPTDPDAPAFIMMKDYLKNYIEIGDFTENEHIVIFRSINSDSPIPEAMFFFVNDEGMYECKRIDLASNSERKDRSETLSAAVSFGINEQEEHIIDDLTGDMYSFISFTDDCAYYVKGKSSYPWGKDGYTIFDSDSLPVIDEFTYAETREIIDVLTTKTVICEITVGDYTLHLTGQRLRKDSNGVIHLYNPQTVISKNGDYIGSINMQLSTFSPYGSSMLCGDSYTDHIPRAYIMNDSILIINGDLENSYFGEGCFSAVINDALVELHGYWPDMTDSDPPTWTDGKQGYSLIVDTESQTVICGFKQYKFELNELSIHDMYNYTVSWLEGPIE